jgi:DNA-binding HxlR family transcriptional regulator
LARPLPLDGPADCPVERTLDLLTGRWRLYVLFRLQQGDMRFNALHRSLAPVTPRVLTATLRDLEVAGLIWRQVAATVPPHVTYGLTARGRALAPVWDAMAAWQDNAKPGAAPGRP